VQCRDNDTAVQAPGVLFLLGQVLKASIIIRFRLFCFAMLFILQTLPKGQLIRSVRNMTKIKITKHQAKKTQKAHRHLFLGGAGYENPLEFCAVLLFF
jgi:hypothetical protein